MFCYHISNLSSRRYDLSPAGMNVCFEKKMMTRDHKLETPISRDPHAAQGASTMTRLRTWSLLAAIVGKRVGIQQLSFDK